MVVLVNSYGGEHGSICGVNIGVWFGLSWRLVGGWYLYFVWFVLVFPELGFGWSWSWVVRCIGSGLYLCCGFLCWLMFVVGVLVWLLLGS